MGNEKERRRMKPIEGGKWTEREEPGEMVTWMRRGKKRDRNRRHEGDRQTGLCRKVEGKQTDGEKSRYGQRNRYRHRYRQEENVKEKQTGQWIEMDRKG